MKIRLLGVQSAVLGTGAVFLALVVLMRVALLFVSDRYNWDIDHEMYFGQRLLSGELLWTREYHDKLPFLQILFAVPAWFESIQVWRIMSLASCVLAALSMPYLLPRVFAFPGMSSSARKSLMAFAATLYLALCLVLPAGLTHFNPMGTSFALVATLLMIASAVPGALPRNALGVALLGGSLLAAMAISIRPYFLAPLVVTGLWGMLIYPMAVQPGALSRNLRLFAGWAAATTMAGLVLNLLPYVLTGRIDAFFAGLSMLRQELHPEPFSETFFQFNSKVPIFLVSGFVMAAVLLLLSARRGSYATLFLPLPLVCAAAMLAFVAQSHWWLHYFQMFPGYLCLTLIFLLAWIYEGRLRFQPLTITVTSLFLAVFSLGLFLSSARAFTNILSVGAMDRVNIDLLGSVEEYMAARPGQGFFYPQDMFPHWYLKEPRHGFPHAANTGHILDGWWRQIEPSAVFATPTDRSDYCNLLHAQGPEIVIVTSNFELVPCLHSEEGNYRLDATFPSATEDWSLLFFNRD